MYQPKNHTAETHLIKKLSEDISKLGESWLRYTKVKQEHDKRDNRFPQWLAIDQCIACETNVDSYQATGTLARPQIIETNCTLISSIASTSSSTRIDGWRLRWWRPFCSWQCRKLNKTSRKTKTKNIIISSMVIGVFIIISCRMIETISRRSTINTWPLLISLCFEIKGLGRWVSKYFANYMVHDYCGGEY